MENVVGIAALLGGAFLIFKTFTGWGSAATSSAAPGSAGSSSAGASAGLGGSDPAHPGFPRGSLFGIKPSSWYDAIRQHYSDYVVQADSQGLQSVGGGAAAHDWDFGVPVGTPVRLPGTSSTIYRLLWSGPVPGVGLIEYFRSPNGGVFGLLHLSRMQLTRPNQTYYGGDIIGYSGQPLSPANGSGAHLAVVADTRASQFLMGGN